MTRRRRTGDGDGMIHVASNDTQLALPGMLWPAGCDHGQSDPLFFSRIKKEQANDLMASFGGHRLGPYKRPFGDQSWGLAIDGQAVAVAISSSIVGNTSAGYKMQQVVDLARIARHPDHPGILRVMLRLWRDYLATRWDYWDQPVDAAVSYGLPGKEGNLYRFDGWKFYGYCKPWTGPQNWSNPSKANDMADAIKKLWYYPYPGHPDPNEPDATLLNTVACAYREAQAARRPVREAVMTACGVKTSQAARLIRAARQAGLLPPLRTGGRPATPRR